VATVATSDADKAVVQDDAINIAVNDLPHIGSEAILLGKALTIPDPGFQIGLQRTGNTVIAPQIKNILSPEFAPAPSELSAAAGVGSTGPPVRGGAIPAD